MWLLLAVYVRHQERMTKMLFAPSAKRGPPQRHRDRDHCHHHPRRQVVSVDRLLVILLALLIAAWCRWCCWSGGGLLSFPTSSSSQSSTPPPPTPHQDRIVIISDNPFVMLPNLPRARAEEFEQVLRLNLASPFVAQVHLLNQAPNNASSFLNPSTHDGKLHVHELGWRSTFLDALRYANAVLPEGTVFAVANADIAFVHASVRIAARLLQQNAVLALSRYDAVTLQGGGDVDAALTASDTTKGSTRHRHHHHHHHHHHPRAVAITATLHEDPPWSQDAWIMRTPFPEHLELDFPLGALGSDNRLAYIYKDLLGKVVYNWCRDVAVLHFHASQVRSSAKPRLPMPYASAPPARLNLSAVEWMVVEPKIKGRRPYGILSLDINALLLPGHEECEQDRRGGGGEGGCVIRMQQQHTKDNELHVVVALPQVERRKPLYLAPAAHKMHAVLDSYNRRHRRGRPPANGRGYYLDVPWSILARTRSPLYDGTLLKGLRRAKLLRPFDRLFALVPQEAIPVVCNPRARAFVQKVWLGTASPISGEFEGLVVCPPALA
jgi:hypothetical protein